MLEHLSKARFIKEIADFTHGSEWIYRGINPAVIVFHDSVHLYEKGIRDVYDPLKKLFPQVNFYQVLIDRRPSNSTNIRYSNISDNHVHPPNRETALYPGILDSGRS